MTSYKINPAGVQAVLTQTQADAEAFTGILSPLEGAATSVATATGGSGAIVPALETFLTEQGEVLTEVNNRISAALNGAFEATKAYNDGDYAMVDQYQAAAAASVAPGANSALGTAPMPNTQGPTAY